MERSRVSKEMKEIKEALGYIIPIFIGIFMFLFVFRIAYVDGSSMNNTYKDGDELLCLRLGEPKRGDVVICNCDAGATLVKRVIAMGGDTVDIDFKTGKVKVNSKVLSESYVKEPTNLDEGGFKYPITVPKGCFFVMGDNRNYSTDSRDKSIGYIKESKVKGKVLFKLLALPEWLKFKCCRYI